MKKNANVEINVYGHWKSAPYMFSGKKKVYRKRKNNVWVYIYTHIHIYIKILIAIIRE